MPVNAPDVLSNEAQDGMFVIANVSVSLSGSLLAGVKVYCTSCTAVDGGVPDKLGGWFACSASDSGSSDDGHPDTASVMAENNKQRDSL